MSSVLDVRDLTMRFGGLTAVNKVNFSVQPRQIFSVIGPNGAGKTTVFNAITGIYDPTDGQILFQGREIRRPMTIRTWLGFLVISLITAAGAVKACNIESMWQATIDDNFKYQQSFPYGEAIGDMFAHLGSLPLSKTVVPFLIGAIVGGAGAFAVWNRARRTPDVIADQGIGRTFQNIRLFQEMTVLENVLVGMDSRMTTKFWHVALRLPLYWRERRETTQRAMELLRFVELDDEAHFVARNLSYGHQRRLEIARALASEPKLLLLDEPAAGMHPGETIELMALIRKVRNSGLTILLIEHHMRVVMGISDRIVVLDYGNKIAEGSPQEILANPKVIEAYLGKEELG